MTLTVEQIRDLYPSPQRCPDAEVIRRRREKEPPLRAAEGCYCVGGAFMAAACEFLANEQLCRAVKAYGGFPGETALGSALRIANPVLDEPRFNDQAYFFAGRINIHNDGGDFDAAWKVLGEALAFTAEDYERNTEWVILPLPPVDY